MSIYQSLKKNIPQKYRKKLSFLKWKIKVLPFKDRQFVSIDDNGINFSILVDPNNGYIDEYIYLHKKWDQHISHALKFFLKEGDTFVDVGANIGYFSLFASQIVGPKGKVFSFEPIDFLVVMCQESMIENQQVNINLINKGCSTKNYSKKIHIKKIMLEGLAYYQPQAVRVRKKWLKSQLWMKN